MNNHVAPAVRLRELAFSVFWFAAMVSYAAVNQWVATDLLWSLWIASLTVGYALMLTTAFGGLLTGDLIKVMRNRAEGKVLTHEQIRAEMMRRQQEEPSGAPQLLAALLGLFTAGVVLWSGLALHSAILLAGLLYLAALVAPSVTGAARFGQALGYFVVVGFMVGFFTFHFGFFHYGHSIFLAAMFPPAAGYGADAMREATLDWMRSLVHLCVPLYWPFIVACAISQWRDFAAAARGFGGTMTQPYVNVVRMHITILALGFLSAFGVSGLPLYALLAVYFLPLWGLARSLWDFLRR